MNKTHSKPAYSLIFAFMIMTVMLIIAGTTLDNTTDKIAFFRELEGTSKARLAAESAAEMAILEIKEYETGYENSSEGEFSIDADGDGNDETTGDYTIYAEAAYNTEESDGVYYLPIPGTGSAAPSDECSILDVHLEADHACNWNKLLYGQSVTIPLYGEEGGSIDLPTTASGFNEWYLRVRTPCEDAGVYSGTCDEGVRYEFAGDGTDQDSDGDTIDDDPSIVFWQLVGENSSVSVSLVPDDEVQYGRTDERDPASNTEIPESLINAGYTSGDFKVLYTDSDTSSPYYALYETCIDEDLTTLSLQLNIVSTLDDSEGGSIPYLEYQLVFDGSTSIADTKAVIVGEGYHEGYKGTYYYPYVITRSATGESTSIYTLSN